MASEVRSRDPCSPSVTNHSQSQQYVISSVMGSLHTVRKAVWTPAVGIEMVYTKGIESQGTAPRFGRPGWDVSTSVPPASDSRRYSYREILRPYTVPLGSESETPRDLYYGAQGLGL